MPLYTKHYVVWRHSEQIDWFKYWGEYPENPFIIQEIQPKSADTPPFLKMVVNSGGLFRLFLCQFLIAGNDPQLALHGLRFEFHALQNR